MNAETLNLWLNDGQQNPDTMSRHHIFLSNMHALPHREYGFYFLFKVRTLHLFAWGTDTLKAPSVCDCKHTFQWTLTKAFHGVDTYPLGMTLTLPIYFTWDTQQPSNGNTILLTNGATESRLKGSFSDILSQLSLLIKPSNSYWHPLRNVCKESEHPLFFRFQHFFRSVLKPKNIIKLSSSSNSFSGPVSLSNPADFFV